MEVERVDAVRGTCGDAGLRSDLFGSHGLYRIAERAAQNETRQRLEDSNWRLHTVRFFD